MREYMVMLTGTDAQSFVDFRSRQDGLLSHVQVRLQGMVIEASGYLYAENACYSTPGGYLYRLRTKGQGMRIAFREKHIQGVRFTMQVWDGKEAICNVRVILGGSPSDCLPF